MKPNSRKCGQAAPDFFSATSPNQRIAGPEIHQRLALVFAQKLLEPHTGSILTIGQTYALFNQFAQSRNMPVIKRSDFKSLMAWATAQYFKSPHQAR
jgi:hypothetical protein